MINHIYIDNFRCFVNFECKLDAMELLVGDNGSGKTTILDVLETLRDVVTSGKETAKAFPAHSLTAWDSRPEQTFELGLLGNGGQYTYRLVLEQDRRGKRNRIKSEKLQLEQTLLYEFDGSDAHLYRDDGSAGFTFPFDCSRSALATIPERNENQLLTWFRQRMERVYVFSPDPFRMTAHSEAEAEYPDRYLHHLASWLRHLSQESPEVIPDLRASLGEVIDGVTGFKLERIGETARILKFEFDINPTENGSSSAGYTLPLDHLSDGQKMLVALFTILHAAVQKDATVCIDEPENYVALRELQPWLIHLKDQVEDYQSQCLLISHHPEFINYLAARHGLAFLRDSSGPVRAGPFEWTEQEVISPAELMARGWE